MLVTHTLSAFQLLLIYFTASAHPLSLSKPSAQGEVQDVARGFLRKRALPSVFSKGVGEGTKQFGRSGQLQAQRAGLCGHREASDFEIMGDRTALWSELQKHWEGKDRKLPVVKLGGKKMEPMYESDSSSKSIEDCLKLQEEIAKDHRKMETSFNDLTDGQTLENKAKLQSVKDEAHSDRGSSHRSIDDLFFQGMENVNEHHGGESSGPADKLVDNHLEPFPLIWKVLHQSLLSRLIISLDLLLSKYINTDTATSSGVAKDALHNYKFDGKHEIKVTIAKQ
ncbi:hypothetical protein KEM48_010137 [Puccinia striiformis f. sp. tritici PST-130]|nr:hypothetical protein KEM48_010137 [Puccinia striiformis f. sp. tritici PST-130]